MMLSCPTGRVPPLTVQAYLQSQRQWLRPHRIALAQAEKRLVTTDSERAFWNQVIKANEDK